VMGKSRQNTTAAVAPFIGVIEPDQRKKVTRSVVKPISFDCDTITAMAFGVVSARYTFYGIRPT